MRTYALNQSMSGRPSGALVLNVIMAGVSVGWPPVIEGLRRDFYRSVKPTYVISVTRASKRYSAGRGPVTHQPMPTKPLTPADLVGLVAPKGAISLFLFSFSAPQQPQATGSGQPQRRRGIEVCELMISRRALRGRVSVHSSPNRKASRSLACARVPSTIRRNRGRTVACILAIDPGLTGAMALELFPACASSFTRKRDQGRGEALY